MREQQAHPGNDGGVHVGHQPLPGGRHHPIGGVPAGPEATGGGSSAARSTAGCGGTHDPRQPPPQRRHDVREGGRGGGGKGEPHGEMFWQTSKVASAFYRDGDGYSQELS